MRTTLKTLLVFGFSTTLAFAPACKKKEAPPQDGGAPVAVQPSAGPDAGAGVAAARSQISAEEYEKLLLGLAACNVTGRSVDPKCPARAAYNSIRSFTSGRKLPPGPQLVALAKKHATHAAPAVRLAAAGMLRSFFGSDGTVQQFVLDRANVETEPAVMGRLLEVVGSRSAQNPAVRALLLKSADDPSEIVRTAAVSWLASSWAQKTPGALDKVLEKIEKDPSPAVRSMACRDVYKHEDERVLPVLKKFAVDEAIGASCIEGIGGLWGHFMVKKRSEKAYRAFLELLRRKPRSPKMPPWQVMSLLGKPVKETWYKQDEVVALLKDIVADKQSMWMARTGAVRALKDLKVDKKVFEELAKGYENPQAEHKLVLNQIQQAAK